uniref:Extracellular Endonuclease subunit A domain-containing protein n=1 Tax=Parascaris univalens TaxID=6257 RepID=A0A915BHG5_PARUN
MRKPEKSFYFLFLCFQLWTKEPSHIFIILFRCNNDENIRKRQCKKNRFLSHLFAKY